MPSPVWHQVLPHYDHLVLYPPPQCGTAPVAYEAPAYLAGLHGLTINAGGVARPDEPRGCAYCHELGEQMKAGRLDDARSTSCRPGGAGDPAAAQPPAVCGAMDPFGLRHGGVVSALARPGAARVTIAPAPIHRRARIQEHRARGALRESVAPSEQPASASSSSSSTMDPGRDVGRQSALAAQMPELVGGATLAQLRQGRRDRRGARRRAGDACIVMDADLQHPPSLIPTWCGAGARADGMSSRR